MAVGDSTRLRFTIKAVGSSRGKYQPCLILLTTATDSKRRSENDPRFIRDWQNALIGRLSRSVEPGHKVQHISGQKNVTADLLSRWIDSLADNEKLQNLVPGCVWIPTHLDLTLLNYDI